MTLERIAFVVQRCHDSVLGGAEALAWQWATLVREEFSVEVLTTTATDYTTWENVLPEGIEEREGITIRRFTVDVGRGDYWHLLHERLKVDFAGFSPGDQPPRPWTPALQEEFIRFQGPYPSGLFRHLEANRATYRAVIFVTYLYPPSYFGTMCLPAGRMLLAPTLDTGTAAFLPAYREMAERVRAQLWLTDAERRLSLTLWGDLPGRIVPMTVDMAEHPTIRLPFPFLLYCGRIDSHKGCGELIEFFLRYKENHPGPLRLVLTGKDAIGLPDHPEIEYRGFVSDAEKFGLMAGARAFVMPSPYESLSIVTLEALARRTPVIVNGRCEVLADHVALSGAGVAYDSFESFAAGVSAVTADESTRVEMGEKGRRYVAERFEVTAIRTALIEEIQNCG